MNTQDKVVRAAYVVEIIDSMNPKRFTPRAFTPQDGYLINSRQAAMQHVQLLILKKEPHIALTVTVKLVEVDRLKIPNTSTVVATIFQQQFPASMNAGEPSTSQETISSPDALWNGLQDLDQESGYYYECGHATGFGYVQLNQVVERDVLAQTAPEDLQTLPTRCFSTLYDAFPFAASLISRYNEKVADSEILSFSTLFLPN